MSKDLTNYKYEVQTNNNNNFFSTLLDNYINDFITLIVLIVVSLLTYLIKFKVLPKIDKLESRNKFHLNVQDDVKIMSCLGAINALTGAFKSLLVLFHDKDDSGYFTKYSIKYQCAINGYEVLRENYLDLDIRILDAEIQNMRNNNGYHIVYKRNYHLTKRMQQWMNKQNIVAAYARLLYDCNNNEIGAVYIDFNTEIDNSVITTKLTDLLDTIEAIVAPYYL